MPPPGDPDFPSEVGSTLWWGKVRTPLPFVIDGPEVRIVNNWAHHPVSHSHPQDDDVRWVKWAASSSSLATERLASGDPAPVEDIVASSDAPSEEEKMEIEVRIRRALAVGRCAVVSPTRLANNYSWSDQTAARLRGSTGAPVQWHGELIPTQLSDLISKLT